MSYSVFRVKGITNTEVLKGLSKHNKDRISYTNLDIKSEKSIENIELISCEESYKQKFNKITFEMREKHNKRMQNMRSDRIKSFDQYINNSKNNVACEMLFTSDEEFFKNMNKEQIKDWAEASLDFVIKDIGIQKENILHAIVHMDEKTPHLHVVCIPIIRAYDKRVKEQRLSINQTKYIGNRENLIKLQDLYNKSMNDIGYDLERGERNSRGKKHKKTIEFKREELKKESIKIEELERENEYKFRSIQDMLKGLSKSEDHIKSLIGCLDRIEVKRKPFSHNLSISQEDYGILISLAKSGEEKLLENLKLKAKIGSLEDKLEKRELNVQLNDSKVMKLSDKNIRLKKENMKLRDSLSKVEKAIKSLGVANEINKEIGTILKRENSHDIDV